MRTLIKALFIFAVSYGLGLLAGRLRKMTRSCACLMIKYNGQYTDYKEVLSQFGAVRDRCSALRSVLIPDDVWKNYKGFAYQKSDKAYHKPMLFLAFRNGYLEKLTMPVHRYLMNGSIPREDLVKDYVQSLKEGLWMKKSGEVERHRNFKKYFGRLMELLLAAWLEANEGWTITNLAAWDPDSADIEMSQDTTDVVVEVNMIGQEDEEFTTFLNEKVYAGSPYTACDFLMFRIYEAGKQLENFSGRKIAAIVISNMAWHNFSFPLENGWINWYCPEFFKNPDFVKFLQKQPSKYRNVLGEVVKVFRMLDEIWILKQENEFEFTRILKQKTRVTFCSDVN